MAGQRDFAYFSCSRLRFWPVTDLWAGVAVPWALGRGTWGWWWFCACMKCCLKMGQSSGDNAINRSTVLSWCVLVIDFSLNAFKTSLTSSKRFRVVRVSDFSSWHIGRERCRSLFVMSGKESMKTWGHNNVKLGQNRVYRETEKTNRFTAVYNVEVRLVDLLICVSRTFGKLLLLISWHFANWILRNSVQQSQHFAITTQHNTTQSHTATIITIKHKQKIQLLIIIYTS